MKPLGVFILVLIGAGCFLLDRKRIKSQEEYTEIPYKIEPAQDLLVFPVLDKDETYSEMAAKLEEEQQELAEAAIIYEINRTREAKEHLIEEAQDCIQVLNGVIDKLQQEGADLKAGNDEHLKKLLIDRKWKIRGFTTVKTK